MIMLNAQKRNRFLVVFLGVFFIHSCHAQTQQIKTFFEVKKKNLYQNCIKETGINTIKQTENNEEIIKLAIKGCEDRGIIFNNFMEGTSTLLNSLSNKDGDYLIFNWKVYSHYIPAPTVTALKTDKTNIVEFTYYDEVTNKDDNALRKNIYKEEGKFKNELQYIQAKLSGKKMDDNIARYQRNDYYIIKKNAGKYYYYTLINGNLKQEK